MAGMQFEYDEKGGTFYFFLVSFLALIIFPSTYWFWPREEVKDDDEYRIHQQCMCDPCQMKRQKLKTLKPWFVWKKRLIKLLIVLGWILFLFVAYKITTVELEFKEFDPFAVLGIDRGASDREVKKKYRELTKTHHPDKGGDPKQFMLITKAYQALTDEETKKNWEEHGDPDGPGATHFGIALPKWIVERENSVWVLAVYALLFMVLLPVAVGMWWYRSIQYSAESILMDTTELYYFFFHKSPSMNLKRVLMILAASWEFESGHNNEIEKRPSDNEEVPALMRDLNILADKKKEQPFCFPYSIKARALLTAHLIRSPLSENTLSLDKCTIVKKCPYLLNEMINIAAHLVALSHAKRVTHEPRLDTVEHCMKLSQMIVQGLSEKSSSLLSLPHISEDMLRHFSSRRRHVRGIKDLVCLSEDDRRSLLRTLPDHQFHDVMNVCGGMPNVNMNVVVEVLDDEDKTITVGSIVTVTVELKRQAMGELFGSQEVVKADEKVPEDLAVVEAHDTPVKKPKAWEKQTKKKKVKGGKVKKPAKKMIKREVLKSAGVVVEDDNASQKDDASVGEPEKAEKITEVGSGEPSALVNEDNDEESTDDDRSESEASGEDEEADWKRFQEEAKKENTLETKSKKTHEVHCPYYPNVKYEWWWLYVCDRKNHLLITAPVQLTSLKENEEVQLKFSAPPKSGSYQYTVVLRSDSYIDFDQMHTIKLDVKGAKKIESHQWDMLDDEEQKDDEDEDESDYSSYESD